MSRDRLPAHLEVASILRRAQVAGDFATILRKGDPERGSLLLMVNSRGRHIASLERVLSLESGYAWRAVGPGIQTAGTCNHCSTCCQAVATDTSRSNTRGWVTKRTNASRDGQGRPMRGSVLSC